MSAHMKNKRKSFNANSPGRNDTDLAPRARNKADGGRKYVEKTGCEWSNKHKNHDPRANKDTQPNPSNAWKGNQQTVPEIHTGSGIVKVTGPPTNRGIHQRGQRPNNDQMDAYYGQSSRTFSRSHELHGRDISNINKTLSRSFEESCSLRDKGATNIRDQEDGYVSPYETIGGPGEGYSDYDDWDSDYSSDLIKRCFELSQSPPDPHKPDIHSVLQSLMQEKGDDGYEQFKAELYSTDPQSDYFYNSGTSGKAEYSQSRYDQEGARNMLGNRTRPDNSSGNKRMRMSPVGSENPSPASSKGRGNWKQGDKRNIHKTDRRIVVNRDDDDDDSPHKTVRSAVVGSPRGDSQSLSQLASYGSSEGSSDDEGSSSRPKSVVRSVIVKREDEDEEMPSLEDASDDASSNKSKSKSARQRGKSNSAAALRLKELKKLHEEKKKEAERAANVRQKVATSVQSAMQESDREGGVKYPNRKDSEKTGKHKGDRKHKKGKGSGLYVPPHLRDNSSNEEDSGSDSDSPKKGGRKASEIKDLRNKIKKMDELVRLKKKDELARLKKEIEKANSAIMQKDSEIMKLRKQAHPSSDGIASSDSEMLRQRTKSRPDTSAAILRIREKTRSDSEANISSDSEMLRQRTKAQNRSGPETVTSDESEILRLRRNQSSSSLAESDAVASSDSDVLHIRRNLSNPNLEGSDGTKKTKSSKSWADLMDQVPELEQDDGDEDIPAAPQSEPRKRMFNFGADESSPSDRKPKQRLSLGSASTGSASKTKRSEWLEGRAGNQKGNGGKVKTRYEIFQQESRKTLPTSFQEAANSWRKGNSGANAWRNKSGKRAENKIWGRQSPAKETKTEKDHTDASLSYQERLDALRSKCSHMYQKPGGKSSGGMSSISWNTGNWKAKFQKRYENLPEIAYIDTHCHIDFLFQRTRFRGSFAEYLEENSDTVPVTFAGCVAVFCNPSTYFSEKDLFLDLLDEPNIHGAVGVHPKSATDFNPRIERQMRWMLGHEKVVALGEIGLDYSGTFYQEAATQKRVFIKQLKMAEELDLPIVIHCRDAEEDCVDIMEQTIDRHHVIHRHCWTGSWEECEIWMDKFPNSFIGLTPLVTHTSGRALPVREVAARLPLDRLLLETDAPYFVPSMIPKEGMKFTHPALAITVASEVAALQDVPVSVVLKAVAMNTYKMYGVKPELQ